MIISVVPDLVPFVDDATNKIRVALCVHSHQEKRRLHICHFKNIQNLRRPSRVRAVVKSDCDLVLAAGTLVIKRWELCKLHVLGSEISICVNGEPAHSIRAILVNGYNLALADVRYCVRRFYRFERLSRLIIKLEIAWNV